MMSFNYSYRQYNHCWWLSGLVSFDHDLICFDFMKSESFMC